MNIIFLVILLIICFWKIKYVSFNQEYCGIEQSTSIKGIFICLVFLTHSKSYINMTDTLFDNIYQMFFVIIGQMIVGMFLFYSGYGIAQSYATKPNYLNNFLKNRVFLTWIHFALIVIIYAVISIILNKDYELSRYILSLIGWSSVGNSNWYIFDIIMLYLLSYIALKISKKFSCGRIKTSFLIMIFSAILFIFLYFTKSPENWWFDTISCFVFGFFYSSIKDKFDVYLKNTSKYILLTVSSFLLFGALIIIYFKFLENVIIYLIMSCLFCLIILLLSIKFKIGNKFLNWCGKNLFYIYILQRIPMIILREFNITNTLIFVPISFVLTVLLTVLFSYLYKKLDNRIINHK